MAERAVAAFKEGHDVLGKVDIKVVSSLFTEAVLGAALAGIAGIVGVAPTTDLTRRPAHAGEAFSIVRTHCEAHEINTLRVGPKAREFTVSVGKAIFSYVGLGFELRDWLRFPFHPIVDDTGHTSERQQGQGRGEAHRRREVMGRASRERLVA